MVESTQVCVTDATPVKLAEAVGNESIGVRLRPTNAIFIGGSNVSDTNGWLVPTQDAEWLGFQMMLDGGEALYAVTADVGITATVQVLTSGLL